MFSIGELMNLVLMGLEFVHIFLFTMFQLPLLLRQVMRFHRILSTELRYVRTWNRGKIWSDQRYFRKGLHLYALRGSLDVKGAHQKQVDTFGSPELF